MVTVTFCAPLFFLLVVKCQDLTSLIDVETLSELPLESLLNARKNIVQFAGNDIDGSTKGNDSTSEATVPEALPLIGSQKIKSKEGYYVQYGDGDKKFDKKKNISTIFQLSVTTLAFLAFGGYLLYLVTAAIKGKNYNYMYDPNATQVMSALINAQLNRRKKMNRRKRPIRVGGNAGNVGYKQGYNKKTHKKLRNKREVSEHGINPENMYSALTNLCEGYTKFYGLDKEESCNMCK